MINTLEIVEIHNAGVRFEQRKPLPHQQKWAIKLSFLLHALLIASSIIMSSHTAPAKYPLVIDFTVESAELLMKKKAEPVNSSPPAEQSMSPEAASPVAPIHTGSPQLNEAGKTRVSENTPSQTLPLEMRPATAKQMVKPTNTVTLVSSPSSPEEQTPDRQSSTAFTSNAAPAGSAVNKADIGSNTQAAGNHDHPAHNLITATVDSEAAKNEERQYLRKNFDYIRNLIMRNLSFPAAARRLGWTGKILVSFIIREDGNVEDITILSSSGHEVLDGNVVAAIRRTAPFPEPEAKARFMLPIVYSLK